MKLMGSVNDTDCFIISNELLFTQLFEKKRLLRKRNYYYYNNDGRKYHNRDRKWCFLLGLIIIQWLKSCDNVGFVLQFVILTHSSLDSISKWYMAKHHRKYWSCYFMSYMKCCYKTLIFTRLLIQDFIFILWFIIRNTYLFFVSIPGTELLKPLKFPKLRVIKMSWYLQQTLFNYTWVYVNEVSFEKHLRMRVCCQGNQFCD